MLGKRGRVPIAEIFAVPVLLVCYLNVIGYLYSAKLLYANVMAIHTGFLFGFLAFAIVFTAPEPVLASTLVSPSAGGILSRRILFAVLLLVPTFGLVRLRAQALGWVSLEYGTALFVLLVVTVFTILTLHTASVLNEVDRKRQETESALLRSEKLAAAGRMAASVAHEINNPLEAMGNLLFLLRTPGLPEKARNGYLETAEQELNRVAAIARRTLAFYRETAKPTEVDLCSVIDSALGIYSKSLSQHDISVRKSYCEDARVLAAEGELHQIVANLISNAVDASPPQNARLDIMIRSAGHFVFLEIADNGQGIESTNLARIFEPFFSTKQEYGTGLGLWITRELVARNRGTITVSSACGEQNHGTTFTIMFPALSEKQEFSRRVAVEQAGA
jgi:signal transduction histidine kinase